MASRVPPELRGWSVPGCLIALAGIIARRLARQMLRIACMHAGCAPRALHHPGILAAFRRSVSAQFRGDITAHSDRLSERWLQRRRYHLLWQVSRDQRPGKEARAERTQQREVIEKRGSRRKGGLRRRDARIERRRDEGTERQSDSWRLRSMRRYKSPTAMRKACDSAEVARWSWFGRLWDHEKQGAWPTMLPMFCLHRRGARIATVTPKQGTALLFWHGQHQLSPKHEGSVVTGGRKYVLRSDVMFSRTPPAEPNR